MIIAEWELKGKKKVQNVCNLRNNVHTIPFSDWVLIQQRMLAEFIVVSTQNVCSLDTLFFFCYNAPVTIYF